MFFLRMKFPASSMRFGTRDFSLAESVFDLDKLSFAEQEGSRLISESLSTETVTKSLLATSNASRRHFRQEAGKIWSRFLATESFRRRRRVPMEGGRAVSWLSSTAKWTRDSN